MDKELMPGSECPRARSFRASREGVRAIPEEAAMGGVGGLNWWMGKEAGKLDSSASFT